MEHRDNYAAAAAAAKRFFQNYDQEALARKLRARMDGQWLYVSFLGEPIRLRRSSGDMERQVKGSWVPADSFSDVMTLLDLICDSREDRFPSGKWKNMASFGLQFHENLLENARDPWAERLEREQAAFSRACAALGGTPFPHGDLAWCLEVFDGLKLVIQLWFGDEDFPAQVRWLWDENALMYLRYETMYYCIGALKARLAEYMEEL